MKETVFKRGLSLLLCMVMIAAVLPFGVQAEILEDGYADMQEGFYEEGDVFNPFFEEFDQSGAMEGAAEPIETVSEAPANEPVKIPVEPLKLPDLFSDADRKAILNRKMPTWIFPLPEEYFGSVVDFAGCRGSQTDSLYAAANNNCTSREHGELSYGTDAATYRVPNMTEVYAPVDGVLYRSTMQDQERGFVAVIEQKVSKEYSYYIVLGNISDFAPVASGSNVSAGSLVAYTGGRDFGFSAVMTEAGKGQQIAEDAYWELFLIANDGWLTESEGTGMICVNPSKDTKTSFGNSLTDYLNGPITFEFVKAEEIPTEAPTQAPTEAPTEAPTQAPTEAPTEAPTQAPHTEHIWDGGRMDVQPTHTSGGVMTYTCTVCGETRSEQIPATSEHVYDQARPSDACLAVPGSCTKPATYFYVCECGAVGFETYTFGDESGHKWNDGVVTSQPTHTTEGVKTYTCTACGETRTEPVAKTSDHTFDQKVTEIQFRKSEPTCTEPAVYYFSCICGEIGTQTFTDGTALGHSYSDKWLFDENNHWHPAICGHDSERRDSAAHTWNAGEITAQAGHEVNGEKTYTCTVCGAQKHESIPGAAHVYDQQVVDAKFLKTAATCTEPAVYFKSCSCGEKGTETFQSGVPTGHSYATTWSKNDLQHWHAATCSHTNEKTDIADHTWDAGKVTLQPTATSKGIVTYTCAVCGQTKTEELEITTHTHTFSTTWTGNNSYHWHAATCEHTNQISSFGEHVWNGGVITVNPTHYAKGEKLFTCQTCGAQKREVIAEAHIFDRQVASSQYLKSNATCTTPAQYYLSCSCGAKGTSTFSYGAAYGHSMSNIWSRDNNYHWTTCINCGAKSQVAAHSYNQTTNTCSTCGFAKPNAHVHTSHLARVPAKSATCTQPGNDSYYICDCGLWFTDVTATVTIDDHNSVTIPATGHVDKDQNGKCDVCRERLGADNVDYQMTEGAEATWVNSSSQGLVFRSNCEYSKFDHVEVDGALISSMNYKVSEGSTIVELSASYMKRLAVGHHDIAIVAKDGKATSGFTVKQAAAAPETAKKSSSALWVLISIIAVLIAIAIPVIVGYIYYNKKVNSTGNGGGKYSR